MLMLILAIGALQRAQANPMLSVIGIRTVSYVLMAVIMTRRHA